MGGSFSMDSDDPASKSSTPVPPGSDVPPEERPRKKKEEKELINWTRLLHLITFPCVKHHSITHVANGTYNDIWVLCDGDRKYINQMNANFSSGLFNVNVNKSEEVYYEANSVGFTKIKSGSFLAFELHHNGIIYVSIRESVGGGSYRTVCDCFPIRHDQSVIVGDGGYVYKTNYGDIWIEDGNGGCNHFPMRMMQPPPPPPPKTEETSDLPSA